MSQVSVGNIMDFESDMQRSQVSEKSLQRV